MTEFIPLVDLQAQYAAIHTDVDEAIRRVVEGAQFIMGPDVALFEAEFAAWCGVPHCAGVSSGTAALELMLRVLGIGPGDEVVTVAHTFIATAEAISMVGAKPVFVDIDPLSYTLDPDAFVAAITARTRAVIPVHLYGQPADMTRIGAIAQQHGIAVVEDAAQAHGASWQGTRTGNFGDGAGFSFYPGKNLGAYGDAGAVKCGGCVIMGGNPNIYMIKWGMGIALIHCKPPFCAPSYPISARGPVHGSVWLHATVSCWQMQA